MKIEFIDRSNPSDLLVVNSARVSFDKHHSEIDPGKDNGLIRYLANHGHFTPFTHARETFRSAYSLEPLVNVVDMSPTDLAGMVYKNGYQVVRHSIWGWANLLHKGLVDPDAVPTICNTLWNKYPLSAFHFGLPQYENSANSIYNDEHSDDPDFIDVTMREEVPIFVARQRFKHSVGFTYNEVSRRYVDSDPEFWEPDYWRNVEEFWMPDYWRGVANNKKQGSNDEAQIQNTPGGLDYTDIVVLCQQWYRLNSHIAPEQRRAILPQAMYTSYYVTGSLSDWSRAYNLRKDSHAQQEIQELAEHWNSILSEAYPEQWKELC